MSLSLVLPLNIGSMGFESFSDSEATAAIDQNFRMLLLTAPGEYVMDMNFGVGLRLYLFEQASEEVADSISAEIEEQVSQYMPYVILNDIDIKYDNIDSNALTIRINYSVSNQVLNEVLEMTISL
tara:strand:- start:55 stop:429 length:375 start_codon:yes stop_codon:yes gene_type:complete